MDLRGLEPRTDRFITDSASDITDNNREELIILPINITFGEEEFQDGVTLTHRMFYEKLIESDELPVTSQVPPFTFEEIYRKVKAQGDRRLFIIVDSLPKRKTLPMEEFTHKISENTKNSIFID